MSNIRQLPPVYDGTTVIIQGHILPNAETFAFNLCTGFNYGECDTAIHVNPRYSQNNVIVRNSFVNGEWGPEERDGPAFNVPRGQPVECIMLISNESIKVAFNGQHYCEFRHRIPKERITYLVASGDVQLHNITFYGPGLAMGAYGGGGFSGPKIGASTAPGSFPPAPSGGPQMPYQLQYQGPGGYYTPPHVAFPVPSGYPAPGQPQALTAPGKHMIPGGLFPGRLIYISLVPGPSQFAVNLRYQESGGDIAFHFNPRLQNGVVVRNSCISGNWGNEERDQPSFPFAAGQLSQLIILCEVDHFKVAVNNQHYIEFRHRDPNLQAIQWVEVVADAKDVHIHVQ